MLDRLPRDGFPEIARKRDLRVDAPRWVPHPSFAFFAQEGGGFDSTPGQAVTCGCRVS